MHLNRTWISKVLLSLFINVVVVVLSARAQVNPAQRNQQTLTADEIREARDVFNAGQRFYDEDRFTDAENRFRQVVTRFSKSGIADKAEYYLIRTLSQLGRRNEAIHRINLFATQYPRSKWINDVQELRIQITNQVPARAEAILLPAAPPAPPAQPTFRSPRVYPMPAPVPVQPATVFTFQFQGTELEVSLQREIMRVIFQSDVEQGIKIAGERLKMNPADPVVLSSLNMVASVPSAQGMTMLTSIVKNPPNARARRDALFWMSQSKTDKDATVDTLLGILPSLADDDSEALVYSLSQIGTDKAANALTTIANDRRQTEKVRINAIQWIAQTRTPNRIQLLDSIYKSNMDNSRIRLQALFALNQTREPQATAIVSSIASSDPDREVRAQAVFLLGHNAAFFKK